METMFVESPLLYRFPLGSKSVPFIQAGEEKIWPGDQGNLAVAQRVNDGIGRSPYHYSSPIHKPLDGYISSIELAAEGHI